MSPKSLANTFVFSAVDPIKVGFIFLGTALTSLFFGCKLLYLGWCGLRDGEYPLSESKQLTGFWALLAAAMIFLFGMVTFCCGIATLIFGYFRLQQLL